MWERYPEIRSELDLLEEYIRSNTSSRNRLLAEVVEDLINAGGKRLRPAFTILSAKFGEYDREKILPLAGALEILHTATLVHDDIIDKSSIRRGIPTVAEKYGVDMAVYTGDFLLTRAVLMLAQKRSPERLDVIARAVKTICEGEVDQYRERYDFETSITTYLKRISKKTAVLFGASCLLGAEWAGCSTNVIKALGRFGFYYGMAFQIRDDLLDFISNDRDSGKPVGNDLPKGIVTLPVIYSMGTDNRVKGLLKRYSKKCGRLTNSDLNAVFEIVRESGGIEESRALLSKYIERCKKSLDKLPDNPYREILSGFAGDLAGIA